jgi:hypothetical protein
VNEGILRIGRSGMVQMATDEGQPDEYHWEASLFDENGQHVRTAEYATKAEAQKLVDEWCAGGAA